MEADSANNNKNRFDDAIDELMKVLKWNLWTKFVFSGGLSDDDAHTILRPTPKSAPISPASTLTVRTSMDWQAGNREGP